MLWQTTGSTCHTILWPAFPSQLGEATIGALVHLKDEDPQSRRGGDVRVAKLVEAICVCANGSLRRQRVHEHTVAYCMETLGGELWAAGRLSINWLLPKLPTVYLRSVGAACLARTQVQKLKERDTSLNSITSP